MEDFVFNTKLRNHTNWNVEDGYGINADTESYPHRVLGPGAKAGLDLLLSGLVNDFDDLCRGPVQGFKVHSIVVHLINVSLIKNFYF